MQSGIFEHEVGTTIIREEQAKCAIDILKVFDRYGGPQF